jgi:polyisoprenoid-binding protein YceI
LLDAARFPSVRVEVVAAASPRGSEPSEYRAHAVVHARGRTAPLDLTAHTVDQTVAPAVAQPGDADVGGYDGEVRMRVTGRLDRTALGITVPSFVIGRFLDLEADLTLRPLPDEPGGT